MGTGSLFHAQNRFNDIASHSNEHILASGSKDSIMRIWNVATGTIDHTLQGYSAAVHYVAFSPDDRILASATADNLAILWETNNFAHELTLHHNP